MKSLLILMLTLVAMSCGCEDGKEAPRKTLYKNGVIVQSVLTGEQGMIVSWYHDRGVFNGVYDVRFKNKDMIRMQEYELRLPVEPAEKVTVEPEVPVLEPKGPGPRVWNPVTQRYE